MTYTLIIGDRTYSSWSLRAWLLVAKFDIPTKLAHVSFADDPDGWAALDPFKPANTVPTLVTNDGAVISDSLAIAEELASRHPDAGLWPTDPTARATARTLAAEMHSSFSDLRRDCPMNLRCAYSDFAPSDGVLEDLARLEQIWGSALAASGGPWLCGAYSAADAFYAPVAARCATYGLPLGPDAAAYVAQHLEESCFRQWRAMGLVKGAVLPRYAMDLSLGPWPGPTPIEARVADGPSINEICPYSGETVTDFLAIDDVVYGFCNAFCRDKTMADPAAWQDFMKIYQS